MGEFTVQEGINIQTTHLNKWKEILKTDVFLALSLYAVRDNSYAENGYHIKRGESLSNFVTNFIYYRDNNMLADKLGKDGFEMYQRAHKKINK